MTDRNDVSTAGPSRATYEAPKVELLGDMKDLTQAMMAGAFSDMTAFMAMSMS